MTSFPQTLIDGTGFTWDMWNDGRIGDGTSDAFDAGFDLFHMPYVSDVTSSMSGRQLTISGVSNEAGAEITFERSLYVPTTGGWARFVDTATNIGAATQTVTFSVRTDLGSNYATEILATSSGDLAFDSDDRSILTDDGNAQGDPMVGIAFGDGSRPADYTLISNDDVIFEYTVTLAPGESASILYFGVQSYDLSDAQAMLAVLGGPLPGSMLEGIPDETLAQILNYGTGVSRPDTHYGNEFDDLLGGSSLDETFYALEGDDMVLAEGGADTVWAGDGNDTVLAGAGNDMVDGGAGDDVLLGGDGNDTLIGGVGADHLVGGAGNDLLEGGDGDDWLLGEAGADLVTGGAGKDRLSGGVGDDTLFGDAGDDILIGGDGADAIDGGAGIDLASYAGSNDAVVIDLAAGLASGGHATGDQLAGIEGVEGTPFADDLTGDDAANQFRPGLGEDVVDGAGGFDILDYSDASGPVTLTIGAGTSTQETGGSSRDVITSIEGAIGSQFDDLLIGTADYEEFRGGAGDDRIETNGGDDQALGGSGDDTLIGGNGAETLIGGTGGDYIEGGNGNDWIEGGDGWDTLIAGTGDDVVTGGAGKDTLDGGSGHDQLDGGGSNDVLIGGWGRDTLLGGYGADILQGDGSNDLLDGGKGNDQLTGGTYSDTFVFSKGYGKDVIHDFTPGEDLLDLGNAGFSKFAAVQDAAVELADRLRIFVTSTDKLDLMGCTLDDLQASDVLL
ncbi:calcium-binding protein [Tropicimonas sediminicola]|uniref:Ca2+-binding protein, RTX toxin-related n=1 Tax=Tropicimonas sediminicola TaxID=1031541 RepID=A0A239HLY5_9RHOB|nr:calcium-binding protein [Tropicimonas sediminicola]SNS82165.1 Ca2+-binding protein, RTX toxin-related [Tropicimonas sediminicola]